jgi:hypothetical protein
MQSEPDDDDHEHCAGRQRMMEILSTTWQTSLDRALRIMETLMKAQ